MNRIWTYRLLTIFAPFLVIIVVFGLLELGFRIYAMFNGPFFVYPPKLAPLKTSQASLVESRYALPTHLFEKPYHSGFWLRPKNDNMDKSRAHLTWSSDSPPFGLPANKSQRLSKSMLGSGELIFDILFETDEYGQRITPLGKPRDPKHHLIFWGCSFVMGEGVGQEETLPFYTANATQNYRAYNMGIYGGTISDAWTFTNVQSNLDSVKESSGYGIYVFMDDHISRYKGNSQYLGNWLSGRPLVRPDKDGKVQFLGSWREAHPLLVKISEWIESSVFLTAIHFSVPSVNEKDVEDFVKVVASVRDTYWQKYGSNNPFVVVLYFQDAMIYAPQIKALLEKAQIPYLDYSTRYLENLSAVQMRVHPNDGHPNALAHKIVGELIAEDLNLK